MPPLYPLNMQLQLIKYKFHYNVTNRLLIGLNLTSRIIKNIHENYFHNIAKKIFQNIPISGLILLATIYNLYQNDIQHLHSTNT